MKKLFGFTNKNEQSRILGRKELLTDIFSITDNILFLLNNAIDSLDGEYHFLPYGEESLYIKLEKLDEFIVNLQKYDDTYIENVERRRKINKVFNLDNYVIDVFISELERFYGKTLDYKDILIENEIRYLCENENIPKFILAYNNLPKKFNSKTDSFKPKIEFLKLIVNLCNELLSNIDLFNEIRAEKTLKQLRNSGPITPNLDDEE